MNTREQVELDTILAELRGEIAGLKKRVAQLEAYTLIQNAPSGISIEVTPMSKEDMEAK